MKATSSTVTETEKAQHEDEEVRMQEAHSKHRLQMVRNAQKSDGVDVWRGKHWQR